MVINFGNLYTNKVSNIVENVQKKKKIVRKQVHYLDVAFVSAPSGINGKGRKIPRCINGGLKRLLLLWRYCTTGSEKRSKNTLLRNTPLCVLSRRA